MTEKYHREENKPYQNYVSNGHYLTFHILFCFFGISLLPTQMQICCLLHYVEHVLSLVGAAQPAILGSAPTEIVKSQPECIPCSVMPDSGSTVSCLRQPTSL